MEFRQALAKGDQQRCEALMTQWLIDGASRCETADTLITDAMHGIGQAWRSGSLDVYQERIACAVCLRLIHFLKSALPTPAADAPLALGGTLLGDQYEIPTTLVDLTLYEQGWNTLNLGASLPAESFAQAAHDHSPALIWLSVSSIDDPTTFIADQNRLADAIGEDVSLVVGGNALTDAIRPHLRYTAHCDSLGHLMQLTAMIKNRHGQS